MEGTTHRAILEFNNEVFYSYYTDFDGQSVESLTGVMRSSFSKINIDVRDEKKVTVDELPAVRFVLYSRERQGIEHMLLIFRQKSSNIRMYGVFYGAFPEKDDAGERFMNSFRQLK